MTDRPTLDRVVLVGLVALAAVLRFASLATRGTWDADQGHDMLVLHALVTAGEIPLLGPPTSIGDFHHGVLYYVLLMPAAWLSGADPIGVTAAIAAGGVAAVGVTWWLARSIGGPVAGLVAGLLMAVSASAVEESTFIWNPNLIALTSSIALAAAWRAWTTRRAGWWVVAAGGAVATMHCHVLGVILLPAVVGPFLADVRRGTPGAARAGLVGLALLVASYVPLLVHELGSDFAETRAALAFVAAGGEPSAIGLPVRLLIVGLRVLSWPLAGLVTEAPAAAILSAALVLAAIAWRWTATATGAAHAPAAEGTVSARERTAVRWLGLSLGWSVVGLTLAASGLAAVVPGLPNDHYHAFADPIVFVLVGLAAAGLARVGTGRIGAGTGPARVARWLGTGLAALVTAAIVTFNVSIQPPPVAADGGWPAAARAAARVHEILGERPITLVGLPTFKGTDAMGFPLERLGADVRSGPAAPGAPAVVVLCDALFRDAIGGPCGGPAEDGVVERAGVRVVERFQAAPGRWVSIYVGSG